MQVLQGILRQRIQEDNLLSLQLRMINDTSSGSRGFEGVREERDLDLGFGMAMLVLSHHLFLGIL